MIFKVGYKNEAQPIGGMQSLAEWLGLSDSELNVKGVNALKEITVYTCIKILAETIGKLPLKVYKGDQGKATEHYLYSLLKLRPNPYMSAYKFWTTVEVQRNIYGNAYVWMDCGRDGKIRGLYPLNSASVKIYVDDVGLLSSKNKIWYVLTDGTGKSRKINADEIMHFTGISTDGIAGLSPIDTLKSQVETAAAAGSFLSRALQSGMTTSGIVQYVGDLDENAKRVFRDKFEAMSSGLKNINRVSLLPIGYKYEPIAMKLTDAQFLENNKLTIQQITAAFGIKPHQVNMMDKTSYASQSEGNREFYADTLLAILTMYEQEITYKGFSEQDISEGYYVKFNPNVVLRSDIEKRFRAYAQAVQNGIKTPNECRAMEEDEGLEGGDKLYLNGNMLPIEMAGAAYVKGGEKKE